MSRRPITAAEYLAMLRGRREKKSMRRSRTSPVQELEYQMRAAGVPTWTPEHRFHPVRQWRLDCAWPSHRVAVEVHGGVHARGRHTQGQGFTRDREKMNEAQLAGWLVLEATTEHVQSGAALAWVERALGLRLS